jgi:hypothetical protein
MQNKVEVEGIRHQKRIEKVEITNQRRRRPFYYRHVEYLYF